MLKMTTRKGQRIGEMKEERARLQHTKEEDCVILLYR